MGIMRKQFKEILYSNTLTKAKKAKLLKEYAEKNWLSSVEDLEMQLEGFEHINVPTLEAKRTAQKQGLKYIYVGDAADGGPGVILMTLRKATKRDLALHFKKGTTPAVFTV